MSRDGGRTRRPRGRGGFDDDAFGGGGGAWSPPPDFGRLAPRPSGAGFGGESQATVKWFNPEKGFGFVEVTGGGGDAFLHVSALERAGAKLVEPGAVMKVRTGPGPKGLQVTEVLEITGEVVPTARPAPRAAPRDAYQAPPAAGDGEEMQGVVKWFNPDKGFGFVAPADGGKDVFVHATALERSGMRTLAEGQTVTMRVVQGRKGPEVSTISAD